MNWLTSVGSAFAASAQTLVSGIPSAAHITLLFAIVIALGFKFGKIKFGGIAFGSTFVLFVGIIVGHIYTHCGLLPDGEKFAIPIGTLEFLRDFGLILFVYAIGLSVGPTFVASFKKGGVKLNLLSVLMIVLNIGLMFLFYYLFFDTSKLQNLPMAVGMLSGAVTNTPGLGAATSTLTEAYAANPALANAMTGQDLASAYACAYPLGVLGMIGAVILLRVFIKTTVKKEQDAYAAEIYQSSNSIPEYDLAKMGENIEKQELLLSNSKVDGKTLDLLGIKNAKILYITRNDIKMAVTDETVFRMGDKVSAAGTTEDLAAAAKILGNSKKALLVPNFGVLFTGILLGVLVGMFPFVIPGVPLAIKLGLAGGPLIVAIILGGYGHKFHLVSYTTKSVNNFIRDFGLNLFLAGVGIKAGAGFWDTIIQGDGVKYVWVGFLITVIPILIVGLIARLKFKFNYLTIMGFVAGTYTDPPLLGFANTTAGNEAPAVGYSTVYPLSMFLRILSVQLIVIFCIA